LTAYPAAGSRLGLADPVAFVRRFEKLSQDQNVSANDLDRVRRRVVHLPWYGAAISGSGVVRRRGGLLIVVVARRPAMARNLFWHLPISFGVSGFIATTQGFFVIEWAAQWGLFSVFFRRCPS